MSLPWVKVAFLWALAVACGSSILPWFLQWQGNRSHDRGFLAVFLGDSRRIFANHFFTKADVYFHGGYYPSIFDQAKQFESSHLLEASTSERSRHPGEEGHTEADEEGHSEEGHGFDEEHEKAFSFLEPPKDWIENFGRHFFPSKHRHIEAGTEHELLPWLRFSAELDPHRIETYTVAAFWLRARLHKIDEAEQFLREGWRANPESYAILFELARLNEENRKDPEKARHLYQLALQYWRQHESAKREPDLFSLQQILGHLAELEAEAGHVAEAIDYFERLKKVALNPEAIQSRIDALKQRPK